MVVAKPFLMMAAENYIVIGGLIHHGSKTELRSRLYQVDERPNCAITQPAIWSGRLGSVVRPVRDQWSLGLSLSSL